MVFMSRTFPMDNNNNNESITRKSPWKRKHSSTSPAKSVADWFCISIFSTYRLYHTEIPHTYAFVAPSHTHSLISNMVIMGIYLVHEMLILFYDGGNHIDVWFTMLFAGILSHYTTSFRTPHNVRFAVFCWWTCTIRRPINTLNTLTNYTNTQAYTFLNVQLMITFTYHIKHHLVPTEQSRRVLVSVQTSESQTLALALSRNFPYIASARVLSFVRGAPRLGRIYIYVIDVSHCAQCCFCRWFAQTPSQPSFRWCFVVRIAQPRDRQSPDISTLLSAALLLIVAIAE